MTALQQIVKEAKRMRKLHPNKYAKWTDYVKAASKAIKKPVKKVSGPKAKAKPKTKAKTKAKAKPKPATHTDKGSHNVKIKVVSGAPDISNEAMQKIKKNNESIAALEKAILRNKETLKNVAAAKTHFWRVYYQKNNKEMSYFIRTLKKENTQLKKHIK